MAFFDQFKLIHHKHSGKAVPHHRTSYSVLILLTLLMGLFLMIVSFRVSAGPPITQSGSIQLSGLVPGPPPATAPTIDAPLPNQRFSNIPISVRGGCTSTYIVVLERGGVAIGSVICDTDGRYQLQVDLLPGQNMLKVRQYDLINQSSPISPGVIVFYDLQQPSAAASAPGKKKPVNKIATTINQFAPLIVTTDYINKFVFPNDAIELPIEIIGGSHPYAVGIDWGDGVVDLVSQENAGKFIVSHAFTKPSNYIVKITVTDKDGQKAFTQTVITVNGEVTVTGTIDSGSELMIAWPIYGVMLALLLGFWLGEQHDSRRWKSQPSTV